MTQTTVEFTWIYFFFHDLRISLPKLPFLLCNNLSALYMTINHVFHARIKYIKIDYHYVRECVALGLLHTRYVPASSQIFDLFTKLLSWLALSPLCVKLGFVPRHSMAGINDNSQPKQTDTTIQNLPVEAPYNYTSLIEHPQENLPNEANNYTKIIAKNILKHSQGNSANS